MRRRHFLVCILIAVLLVLIAGWKAYQCRQQVSFKLAFAESVDACRKNQSAGFVLSVLAASEKCTDLDDSEFVERYCLKKVQSPDMFERMVAIVVLGYRPKLQASTFEKISRYAASPPKGISHREYGMLLEWLDSRAQVGAFSWEKKSDGVNTGPSTDAIPTDDGSGTTDGRDEGALNH